MTAPPPAPAGPDLASAERPRVEITYCTQCRWLLRATWLASELLTSFGTDLGEVALRPGTGGVFAVRVDDELVWDRKRDGGFPDLGPLKRAVRDRVAPGRDLGHTDRAASARAGSPAEPTSSAGPGVLAEPTAVPEPSAGLEPTAVPEPTAAPEPSALADSSADLTGS